MIDAAIGSGERLPVAVQAGRQAGFDFRNRGAVAGHLRLLVLEGLADHRVPGLLVRHELHARKRLPIYMLTGQLGNTRDGTSVLLLIRLV